MQFKLKDVCTAVNILLALYAVLLCFEGRLEPASWFIFLAWFTDGLDGLIARLTGTGNEFGAQFDNQADLFIYTVAPAFLVYAVFLDFSRVTGTILCFAIITVGCIRLSRFNVKPLIYPGFWIGYPRSALGLQILFLFNSKFLTHYHLYWAAAAMTLVLTALNLSYVPYRNHKTKLTKFEMFLVLATWFTTWPAYPFGHFWDMALLWSTIYALLPFTPLHSRYRGPIRQYVEEWKASTR